uniref:SHSP domain-containing protein n=1 Tax=Angiostrongylus cantonensis TaxID=6313 RepID=A0A0K0DG48_ANGCA
MSLWRRARSPSWSMDLDRHFDEMSRRIDRALAECRRDMQRFEESFFPSSRYGQAQRVINDDRKFAVTLDVSQFHPDEVKVNLKGRDLIIEGRQEHKDDSSYRKRSFVRKWQLPKDSDVDAINSRLSDSGVLSVEVPKFSSSGGGPYRTTIQVKQPTRTQRETHID